MSPLTYCRRTGRYLCRRHLTCGCVEHSPIERAPFSDATGGCDVCRTGESIPGAMEGHAAGRIARGMDRDPAPTPADHAVPAPLQRSRVPLASAGPRGTHDPDSNPVADHEPGTHPQ